MEDRGRHGGHVPRRLRRHARAAPDPRARALQPHAVLQRQGARARHHRGAGARLRAVDQQEVRQSSSASGRLPFTSARRRATSSSTTWPTGLGDIAAGNLSVTPERLEKLDFYAPPDLAATKEVLVTGPTRRARCARRPRRQDRARAAVVELSREPRGAQPEAQGARGRRWCASSPCRTPSRTRTSWR